MDIVSYLLGKQSGGGGTYILQNKNVTVNSNGTSTISADEGYDGLATVGLDVNVTPNLQTKSVTITQNGTTAVTKDTGYDGLQQVNITTSVSGSVVAPNGLKFGNSTFTDPSFLAGIDFSHVTNFDAVFQSVTMTNKDFPYIDTSSGTSFNSTFQNCRLGSIPLLNTSNATNFSGFLRQNNITTIPLLDTSNATGFGYMFYSCSKLTNIPAINTVKGTNFTNMFRGCTLLTTVPELNLSKATALDYMFGECSSLSNDSLNNILASLLTATSYTGTKTLATLGLTSTQATTCTGLSNWAALSAAGWTTGY